MPTYWRDPDTMDVIKSHPGAPVDSGDVVVIPSEKWRRLVELVETFIVCQIDESDDPLYDEARVIIAEVDRG